MKTNCFLIGLTIALVLAPQDCCAQNWTSREAKYKAVFIYNLMRFTDFDETKDTISLCIAGSEKIQRMLNELDGRKVKNKPIRLKQKGENDSCDVLFVSNNLFRITDVLNSVRDKKTLTISERSDFLSEGGMVKLFDNKGKLSFKVNIKALRRADVRLSSKVLRLASSVDEH